MVEMEPVAAGQPVDREWYTNFREAFQGRSAKLVVPEDTITVSVPSRVHLSVIDMRQFSPGTPGGGGVGFAVDLRSQLRLHPSDGWVVDSGRARVIEHTARLIADCAGYSGGFTVEADDHGIRHLGLGSTTTVLTAVAVGVNELLSRPFTNDELRALIGHNFVEEGPDGQLFPAFETGVGPAVILDGGFAVLEDRLELVWRGAFARDHILLLAIPPERDGDMIDEPDVGRALVNRNSGEDEAQLLMSLGREYDGRDSERKRRLIRQRLIPALDDGNISGVGEAIASLQSMGSKIAEIEHHGGGADVRRSVGIMKDAGALVAGMSSVGPTVVGLFSPSASLDDARKRLEPHVDRLIETRVDNDGARVSTGQ